MDYFDFDEVAKAYKKLKANIFFDKTQLPLRNKLVLFEGENPDEKLSALANALMTGEGWDAYEQEALDSISVLIFPKKLEPIDGDTTIFNGDNAPIEMKSPQYFIDLSVEGHILSTLWVLSVGMKLDKNSDETNPDGMYEHSYGNRLRKNLINPKTEDITYSPGLFQPYFSQYESWRDYGLEKAKEKLKDHQDALILTLDFKSFYYSVDVRREDFDRFVAGTNLDSPWHRRVNDFVFKVIEKYSEKLRQVVHPQAELNLGDRNILPIGFLPSNILSNWALTPFDDAIIEKWNPVYYGRYVDDVIIVDKVEKNSPIYKQARDADARLSSSDIIDRFLVQREIMSPRSPVDDMYRISEATLHSHGSDIRVQDQKVKLFYFRSGSTQALLQCFQTQIAQNKSEFRMMPNLDSILEYRNYSEIFDLKNEDGINKFRGVTGIELDKFALSKFLGKYRKVSGMIKDRDENVFERDLMLIMDERTLIANYNAWERLFEILIVNDRVKLFEELVTRILSAISHYQIKEEICMETAEIHESLIDVLYSAICRTLALSWGEDVDSAIKKIEDQADKIRPQIHVRQSLINDFSAGSLYILREAYCRTRMVNKYILPLPIDCVIPYLQKCEKPEIRLYSLDEMRMHLDENWCEITDDNSYHYYPYMVTPHDLSFAVICSDIKKIKRDIDPAEQENTIKRLFIAWNYPKSNADIRKAYCLTETQSEPMHVIRSKRNLYVTHVDIPNAHKGKISLAIGNAKISPNDFYSALDKHPNRSYDRYEAFAQIFDAAVKENVDLLVLPENYLPFEWLPVVTRLCANNQMALVTGIEHIIVPTSEKESRGYVYNLSATILPYMHDEYPFATISYHNKVEYSPEEKEQIEGHGYTFQNGSSYQLFCWKDVWFPVYCCFELASIQDRALFQSYADMVVAVEWNKDIPYFSNIVESLTRDLHCYCIQANSSDFGDSRVISPTKTEVKDIIRTKGGRNSSILMDIIDIKALRDFQMLGYTLQSKAHTYKHTPPGFNKEILELKRNGNLMDHLFKEFEKGGKGHA